MKKVCILLSGLICLMAFSSCSTRQSQTEQPEVDVEELTPQFRFLPVKYDDNHYRDNYIYLDVTTGKRAQNSHKFDHADYFYEDIALVKQDDLLFYIDNGFNPISEDRYAEATVFNCSRAWVVRPNGRIEAIDKQGQVVFTLDEAEQAFCFKGGVAVFKTAHGECGLVDVDGNIRIQPGIFDYILPGSCLNGYVCVGMVDGEEGCPTGEGLCTYDGEQVIPCEYLNVQIDPVLIRNNRAIVTDFNFKNGVVDLCNNEIIPCEYDNITADRDGSFLIEDRGGMGWLDARGNEIIDPFYNHACIFGRENLAAAEDSKWGFINKKGEWVIEPSYYNAMPFRNDIAPVMNREQEWGAINKKGEFVILPAYRRLEYLGDQLYYVVNENRERGLVDSKGNVVINLTDRYRFIDPVISASMVVNSQFLDVDALMDQMASLIDWAKLDEMTVPAVEKRFDTLLGSSEWITLKSVHNTNFSGQIRGYVRSHVETDFYGNQEETLELISLTIDFDLQSDKVKSHKSQIFNQLAERLGAGIRMNESGYCTGSGLLGITLVPNIDARLKTGNNDQLSIVIGLDIPSYPDYSYYAWEEEAVAATDDDGERDYLAF